MNIKRLLLGFTLLTAVISGCEKEDTSDPLIVNPVGPKAEFMYNGGKTYPNQPGIVEFLYTDSPVIAFENKSTRATSYLWHFGDAKVNPTADTISTEANPTHQYTKPGNYVVTLTATLTENGVTQTSVTSRVVPITFSRKKLLGKYAIIDTLSKVNSAADSMVAATSTIPAHSFSQSYDLTVAVFKSPASAPDVNDSLYVEIGGFGKITNVVKLKALVDNSTAANGFRFTLPDMLLGGDSILDATGRVQGGKLKLRYTAKNATDNKTIMHKGTGPRF